MDFTRNTNKKDTPAPKRRTFGRIKSLFTKDTNYEFPSTSEQLNMDAVQADDIQFFGPTVLNTIHGEVRVLPNYSTTMTTEECAMWFDEQLREGHGIGTHRYLYVIEEENEECDLDISYHIDFADDDFSFCDVDDHKATNFGNETSSVNLWSYPTTTFRQTHTKQAKRSFKIGRALKMVKRKLLKLFGRAR